MRRDSGVYGLVLHQEIFVTYKAGTSLITLGKGKLWYLWNDKDISRVDV